MMPVVILVIAEARDEVANVSERIGSARRLNAIRL